MHVITAAFWFLQLFGVFLLFLLALPLALLRRKEEENDLKKQKQNKKTSPYKGKASVLCDTFYFGCFCLSLLSR
jgi:hypothetical protein